MKKVLFFIESLQCGGAEKSLLSLLNNLDYTNYKVNLMVLKEKGEFEKFVPDHIKIEVVNFEFGLIERLKFKIARFQNRNKKYHPAQLFWQSVKNNIPILPAEYDIAISWGQGFATYFIAEKINAIRKYAWVNTDYEKAGYNAKRDLPIYQKFDVIIGVSDFVKISMEKIIPDTKVISIKNIIDAEEIKNRANTSKTLEFNNDFINLVSVGRLVKPKGFELVIEACQILVNKGHKIRLYIIGEGSERNYLEGEITKRKIDKQCFLLGFKDNPYPYINSSDIYIQSSWFEGLGRTVIEASILCKPIVTTNFPTAYSILEHEKTGLITEMNPGSIASSIERIIDDKNLKESLIMNLKNNLDKEKEEILASVYKLFDS